MFPFLYLQVDQVVCIEASQELVPDATSFVRMTESLYIFVNSSFRMGNQVGNLDAYEVAIARGKQFVNNVSLGSLE